MKELCSLHVLIYTLTRFDTSKTFLYEDFIDGDLLQVHMIYTRFDELYFIS